MLHRFMEASEKRHDETNAMIMEHQNLMRDQQALLRNHQALIQNIEAQLGQLTTLVNEKLSPKVTEKKPQPHVMVTETEGIPSLISLKHLKSIHINLDQSRRSQNSKEFFLLKHRTHGVSIQGSQRGVSLIRKF